MANRTNADFRQIYECIQDVIKTEDPICKPLSDAELAELVSERINMDVTGEAVRLYRLRLGISNSHKRLQENRKATKNASRTVSKSK